jgi:hypothetical protein
VLSNGRTTKKLILAFHFQFANQAAWKCETCRGSGLAEERGCAFSGAAERKRPVWARRGHLSARCPKSFIEGENLSLLEEFFAWKLAGGGDLMRRAAKTVDAFFALETEWRKEMRNGNGRSVSDD